MEKDVKYNRIFIENIPPEFYRPYALRPREETEVPDLSALKFIIEEFISLSATQIAIPKDSEMTSAVDHLHPSLKKKVVIVGEEFELYGKWGAILAPIQEEFNVKLTRTDSPGIYALAIEKDVSEELHQAIPTLFFNLRTFVLGVENELQINLDLESIKQATNIIRHSSKNPETRINLAHLSGLFETYEPQSLTSLNIIPTAYEENISIFQELIEDQIYRNMSEQSHGLGFPAKFQKAKADLRRLSKKLLTKPPYKQLVTLGAKLISSATKFPFEIELATSLIKKKYLPPIITFDKAIKQAQEAWNSADYEPIAPKGFISENFIR